MAKGKTLRARLFISLFVALVSLGVFGSAFAAPPLGVGNPEKVLVCHWDEEAEAHYLISVSENGFANGHTKHGHDSLFVDPSDCAPEPEGDPEPEPQPLPLGGGGFD